jgi:hypothetical protein
LADTADLKSADHNTVVGVQVPLRAPESIDSNALVDAGGVSVNLASLGSVTNIVTYL